MENLEKNVAEEILKEDHKETETNTGTECQCCCIGSQEIKFESCEDVKDFTIQNLELKCEGRFLKIRVQLNNVCKGRKVNVGVLICENVQGTFFIRGFKACQFTVPSNTGGKNEDSLEVIPRGSCTDVTVDEFCFVFPDENICASRTFVAKVVAHYGDFPSFPFCPC